MSFERFGCWVGWLAMLGAAACGNKDHAPFVNETRGETAGSTGSGESGAADSSSGDAPGREDQPAEGGAPGNAGGTSSGGTVTNYPSAKDLGLVVEGTFTTDQVYMGGAFIPEEGRFLKGGSQIGRFALGTIAAPESWVVAFDAPQSHATYLPAANAQFRDGHLLYLGLAAKPFGIRQWVPEGSGSGLWPTKRDYPEHPSDNDTVVETPRCPAADKSSDGPQQFLVGSSGRLIYRCPGADYFEGDALVLDCQDFPLNSNPTKLLGVSKNHLFYANGPSFVIRAIDATEGTAVTLPGKADLVRALDDAFLVVSDKKLHRVELDGSVAEKGTYPNDLNPSAMTRDGTVYGWVAYGDNANGVSRFTPGAAMGEPTFESTKCPFITINVIVP